MPGRVDRLLPVTLALAAGILLAGLVSQAWPDLPAPLVIPALPGALLLALLAGGVILLARRRPQAAALLLLPIFGLAGYLLAGPTLNPPADPNHLYQLLTEPEPGEQSTPPEPSDQGVATDHRAHPEVSGHGVVLVGRLAQLPRLEDDRSVLLMAAEELHRPNQAPRPTRGLVRLVVGGPLSEPLTPGDRFMIRAEVGPVHSFRVPGAFDYRQFLALHQIWLSGWAKSPQQVAAIHDPAGSAAPRLFPPYWPERLRARAAAILESNLEGAPLALLKALLIGDKSGIPKPVLADFQASGGMHLLAISGLHLGLVALLATALFTWLLKRSPRLMLRLPVRKPALLLALLPVGGYALITGLNPPALRALIMILVFMAAILRDRQWCSLNNVAIAALLILVLDPAAIFTASFQLSFAATAGIILFLPQLAERLLPAGAPAMPDRGKSHRASAWLAAWLGNGLLVSLVATLVTAPLVLYHFHRLSLLSPLTTLLLTPILGGLILPLALLALALAAIAPSLTGLLLTAAAWGAEALLALTAQLARLPFASFYLPPPTPLELAVALALLIALVLARNRPVARISAVCLALLLITLPGHDLWQRRRNPATTVSVLDIGQGNATVVQLPHHRTLLVDSGGAASVRFDPGESLIGPFLHRQRVTRLAALVISHPDADHYNGAPFLLRHFRPETLWLNGRPGGGRGYEELLQLAAELEIPVKVPTAGQLLLASGEAKVINLADFHLEAKTGPATSADPSNEQSLAIRVEHQKISWLLPGDIPMRQEQHLVAQRPEMEHSVLLAPHHGSWTSTSPQLLAAVTPSYLVLSADRRRTEWERVRQWREQGLNVLTTAEAGTIIFTTNGDALAVKRFLDRR